MVGIGLADGSDVFAALTRSIRLTHQIGDGLHRLDRILRGDTHLAGCELFTNAIEWFGAKLNLSTGACGSVLAAVGTALPETLVPIVAFIKGGEDAREIGTGGILGAPFMLATLAFTVTAVAVLGYTRSGRRNSADMAVDSHVLSHDLGYFLVAYREGEPCPTCRTAVEKIKTGSTHTHICPSCQPL